jgi:hypothetical protein
MRIICACSLAFLTACSTGDGTAGWRGSIDTLPNGTVVVHNEGGGLWDSATAWRIVEDLRIGNAEGDGSAGFNRIVGLALDREGRIYALEGETQDVRVFDSTGAFVRRFGRKGRGPGEMENASGMGWDDGRRLWVVDPANGRYALFDTTGRVVGTRQRSTSFYMFPWKGAFLASGELVDVIGLPGGFPPTFALARYDTAMVPRDTIHLPTYQGELYTQRSQSGGGMSAGVPYTPGLVWSVDPRGFLWFGITAPYRIYQRRLGGDTVRIIERAYEPLPVAAADRDSEIAHLDWFTKQGGQVDASRIPKVKPAFDRFFLDDVGNLWVDPVTPRSDDDRVFDVFDPDGRYLGRARSNFPIVGTPVFRGERLYAVTGDENDIPYVVRARIERGSPRP